MAKDPAERQLHLHLPRNVTRTNYTSRELPERIRVPHICAQTHTRAVFLSRTREGGEGKREGSFPPRVIRSCVARAKGSRPPSRSTSGVEGEKEARRSIPPDDSADLMRLDLRNRRIAPSKTSGISSLPLPSPSTRTIDGFLARIPFHG